jgi:uncharacterized coiled-coil DUF342 family protein
MVIAFAEQLAQLKRQFLELLEKDLELRYTIAGYLGLSEILKRLDSIEESIRKLWENQNRLWENQNKLWESQNKMWEEIKALRESQNRLWEGQNRLWEEVRALREGQNKLWEGQNRLWEEVRALREGQNKLWEGQNRLWESQNKLWEGQNRLWEEVRELRKDIRDVKITMERITLSLEEEARGFIAYRLKRELGVEVELDRVFVDTLEINVYGAVGDLCVVGEATVRLGPSLVEGLLKKVEVLRMKKPDLLKKKLLKVIYTDVAVPQALQLAKEKGVWVLRWDRDLTPIKIEETLG